MTIDTDYAPSGGDIGGLIRNDDLQASGSTPDTCTFRTIKTILNHLVSGGASMLLGTSVANAQPYLPHVGTSPTCFDSRPVAAQPFQAAAPKEKIKKTEETKRIEEKTAISYEQALTMSIADQAREVSAALSINKTQLAEILGVSRPTLYSWLDGSNPKPGNSDRLLTILRIMSKSHVDSHHPLNARFVRNPLSEDSKPLIELLKTDSCKEEEITSVFEAAKALSDKVAKQAEAREERWRKLGYEEPSFEERKATLNRNITARNLDRSK